jgi:rod shape determining protein RodA
MTGRDKSGSILHGRVDWWTVLVYLLLLLTGWLNLYAAVHDDTHAKAFEFAREYGKQLVWIGVSLALGLVIMLVDDKYYHILAYPVYGAILVLMLSTLVLGREINGAKAWLMLGPVAIQPTEFMKFATSLALARYMSNYTFSIRRMRNLVRTALITGIPIGVMFLQHDVGSAVVYGSFLFMLYREGLNRMIYVILGMVMALFFGSFWITDTGLLILIILCFAAIFAIRYGNVRAAAVYSASIALVSISVWSGLRFIPNADIDYYYVLLATSLLSLPIAGMAAYANRLRGFWLMIALFVASLVFSSATELLFDRLDLHQQKRILDTLNIESDPGGWGYNVNQSKIAIGSGGFFGKGYLEGTQTKFNFVPEQSTDFIFCTVGEEWGFAGSIVVLALFCILIVRLVRMGERQSEPFGRIYCYSAAGIFFLHVMINVGMTLGIVPVIGIPLPFFSYGGSSFLAFTIMLFVAIRLDLGSGELNV